MSSGAQDLLLLAGVALNGLNLVFLLRLLFNDLRHLDQKLDRHLDFSEALHRQLEHRVSFLESQLSVERPLERDTP